MKMKNGKNKGISLIVLVITIIVMIILAGSIILTLSQNGIIGKANEAVDKTNLKQVQEMATVLWLDAYSNGARTQTELKKAVEAGLEGTDISKYNITITTEGVTVTIKSPGELELPIEWNSLEVMGNTSVILDGMSMVKVSEYTPSATELANTEIIATLGEENQFLVCTQTQDMGGFVLTIYGDNVIAFSVTTAGDYDDLEISFPETGFYVMDFGSMGQDINFIIDVISVPTQLFAPIIALSEDTLTITDNNENRIYTANFDIYVGSEKRESIAASAETTFDLTTLGLEAGTYSITVKSVAAEDSTITTSESSVAVTYTVEELKDTTPTQLAKPTIALSGDALTITDNTGNEGYTANFDIYVGSEKRATITATESTFDLETLELEAGAYSITVKSVAAEDSTIAASEASESVEYVIKNWVTAWVDGVPIPKGFVASPYGADEANDIKAENTKNGGLVIYQLTDTEIANGATTLPSTETQFTSWTTRNQYVWVPVDKDNFATEFVRKDFLASQLVVDSTGAYNALGAYGKYWEVIVDSNNLPLKTIAKQNATYMSTATLAEVQAMYASVKKYGGFYIARYEAGIDTQRTSNDDAIVKTLANVHSKMNKIPYNYMKWSISNTMSVDTGAAIEAARSMYTSNTTDTNYNKYGVVSTLTYGVQWDRTVQWFIDTDAMSEDEIKKSTAYGNYKGHTITSYTQLNSGARYTTSGTKAFSDVTSSYAKGATTTHILTTGALKAANINNIYDMAGNVFEWTMEGRSNESYSDSGRVLRGGYYGDTGTVSPLAYRTYDAPINAYGRTGFRTALYIKK